jgi:alkylated DNA repair dioxygenase AlkB
MKISVQKLATTADLKNLLAETKPSAKEQKSRGGGSYLQPRGTAFFGDQGVVYRYSGISETGKGWPPLLAELKKIVDNAAQTTFNSVLVNHYRSGNDSVAWHSDDERELDPCRPIASLSFGSPRQFEIAEKSSGSWSNGWRAQQTLHLGDRDLIIMPAGFQSNFVHQVPKEPMARERLNLTFRVLR